ncbi:MAG: pyridoxamine 5'-phosphate oxidase [Pseudomonadota bacterium]
MSELREPPFAGDDPLSLISDWLEEATPLEPNDPNAAALATVAENGVPSVRIVLVKTIEANAVVFYTNYESRKARELDSSGTAAICFHWKSLRRQIRLVGTITREEGPDADAYYTSRSLGSRRGAWASAQSTEIPDRSVLEARVAEIEAEFGDNPPRPPFWGGYRLTPLEVEFWADGAFRLHDRFVWRRTMADDVWSVARLSP